jgi:replicative DNA helicase
MKSLFSQKSEIALLKTITDEGTSEKLRAAMLGRVDLSFFHTPYVKRAFKRVLTLTEKRQIVPSWDDLIEDPSFSSEVRSFLKDSTEVPIEGKARIKKTIARLDNYRKLRLLYETTKDAVAYFDRDELDPDELADRISQNLANTRKNFSTEHKIWKFGKGGNAKALVRKTLHEPKEKMYLTGFTEYDERNGGLPTSGVLILAGTTSGGKSVLANNLMNNMCLLNKGLKASKVTLEMTDEQEMNRVMAMITGMPFWKFKHDKMTKKEKVEVEQRLKAWERKLKKNESTFSFTSPDTSMSIEDCLAMYKPYGYNMIVLDYISLLEGVDDDNQWRKLSAIARQAKMFTKATGCLFVILCQLDSSSNELRYSKGIREHADVMWAWNYTSEEQRALKVLPVKIAKARDGELFNLDLKDEFEIMRVSNLDSDDSNDNTSSDSTTKKKKRNKNRGRADDVDDDAPFLMS